MSDWCWRSDVGRVGDDLITENSRRNGERAISIPPKKYNKLVSGIGDDPAMTSLADPFPVAKEEVQQALAVTKALYERWKQLVSTTTSDSDEVEWTCSELLSGIQNLEWDLEDLNKAVAASERSPSYDIDPLDLRSRKQFITDTKTQVVRFKTEVDTHRQRESVAQDRDALLSTSGGGGDRSTMSRVSDLASKNNQDFIDHHVQQQDVMVRQQDEDLEGLGHTVSRLGHIGLAINEELTQQQRMLEDLDEDMDRTESKMQQVMGKVDLMLKSSDKGKLCTIFILTIIFVILLAAVIYF